MPEVKKWRGTEPTKCENCNGNFTGNVFYDAYLMTVGRWCLCCMKCFMFGGGRLGTGCGQKYDLTTKLKIDG